MGLSSLCPICEEHPETVEHMLLLCTWNHGVWFGGALNYHVGTQEITTFDLWLGFSKWRILLS